MTEIVVIEDDEDLGKLLIKILETNGFQTTLFRKGENFLAHRKEADIYIIDINLGGINGIEICSLLKTEQRDSVPRILIISAHPELRELATKAGADACLTKPFRKQELLAILAGLSAR